MLSEEGPRSNSSASPNKGQAHDCPLSISPRLARKASSAESVRSASPPSIDPSLFLGPTAGGGCVQLTGGFGWFGAEEDDAPGVSQGMCCCEPPADVVLCSGDTETSSLAVCVSNRTLTPEKRCHSRSFLVRPLGCGLGTSSPFAFRYNLGNTHGMPSLVLHRCQRRCTHARTLLNSCTHTMIHRLVGRCRMPSAGLRVRYRISLPVGEAAAHPTRSTYFASSAGVATCSTPFPLVRLWRF